jgi:hypothetical protein
MINSSTETVDKGIRRLLRLLAVGFITIAGLSLFISLMAKRNNERRKQANVDSNPANG